MRTLITGGAGFLGTHLVEHLAAQGHAVHIIDNFATARRDSVPVHPAVTLTEGSVADRALVGRVCDEFRPERVIHGAASYKNPDDWLTDIESNIAGTVNVIEAARRHACRRFIYLQTALCYGTPRERPITLDHRREPFTSYSITKTAGEQFVQVSGLPYVSLRLANVYGPRNYTGPMPTFYKRLKAGQECTIVDTRRDFLEVQDFLDLIDRIFATEHVGCFHVSSGRDVTIQQIFELMVELMGIRLERPATIQPRGTDDVATLLLDPSATEQTFGWKASVPLRDGLKRLIDSYERDGVLETYTHLQMKKAG